MNIALLGYGKMGKAIEEIATQKGHKIVMRINDQNLPELTKENLQKADVAIEFTSPQSAVENILLCFESGVPVVCGTTGWLSQIEMVKEKCSELNATFLYASNFNYNVSIEEIHHTEKKDAPSGTAITLAEQIIDTLPKKNKWVNKSSDSPEELSIISKRIDPAAGTHSVKYTSDVDDIEIIHTAHNRKGFAFGALLAAEFIFDKKGIFNMKDVLDI
jgi:4-hydroxy-tetrahydrodipicolinate reductase